MRISIRHKKSWERGRGEGKPQPEVICSDLFSVLASPQGAFWGLMVGLAVGVVRMIMDLVYTAPSCGEEDRRPAVLKDVHYLYFALILCALTAIVIIIVSLFTPPIPEEKVSDSQGHTFPGASFAHQKSLGCAPFLVLQWVRNAVPGAGQTPQPIITGIERKEEGEGDEITLQSTAEEELNRSNCSI